MSEQKMYYYNLIFSDGEAFKVSSELKDSAHFLKYLRRYVSSYVFDNTTYLEHPVKFTLTDSTGTVYKNWIQA